MLKYFTTPIYYVNGKPHIGSAYTTLATDTFARYWRKKIGKEKVFFLTGTDENSQKTIIASQESNLTPQEYLEKMSQKWRETFSQINISFDGFIRTTEEKHFKTVHKIIAKIEETGDIYKGKYSGKYCTGCETFLKNSDLNEKGECPTHLKKPEQIEEDNYFFRLSNYEKPLLDFYKNNPNWLRPEKRKNEIINFIKEGLEDISISREMAEMGIPMANDKDHKIYVWFDALINYYTAIDDEKNRDFWGSVFHIIGKDITRFHCIIWPAMLMSAGIELPQGVFSHGFFTINGHKMSKSLGNVIDPLELSEKFGNDALRLGLLSSFEFGNDGDFSPENFAQFYKSKLAGGIGNLFNRVIILLNKCVDGEKLETDFEITQKEKLEKALENLELQKSINLFFEIEKEANQLLNETEVWKLAKTDLEKAKQIFAKLIKYLEVLTDVSEYFLPETFPKMKKMLGSKTKVGQAEILFPPVE